MFLPHPRVKVSIAGSPRDREVACSASDRQGSYFESCVWRSVSSQSSHHPQEVLLDQFSLYVHKGGLNPDSFHFSHVSGSVIPANTGRWPNVVWMLGQNSGRWFNIVRDMAQWLERGGALPMSLPAVRFRIPHGAGFQRNIMFLASQYWDIISMMYPWARHFTLTCFTWLRCK